MHEVFRRRLEALEEARKLRDGPVQMISLGFVEGDGTRVEPTVARTSDCSFVLQERSLSLRHL